MLGIGFERRASFTILELVRLLSLPGLVAWFLAPLVATGSVATGAVSLGAGIAGGFALLSLVALWLSAAPREATSSVLSSRGA